MTAASKLRLFGIETKLKNYVRQTAANFMEGMPSLGPWSHVATFIGKTRHRLIGNTNGIAWTLHSSYPILSLRPAPKEEVVCVITDDAKGQLLFEIFATAEETPAKVVLFLEEIAADMERQRLLMNAFPDHVQAFLTARKGIKEQRYPEWINGLSRDAKEDEFNKLLIERYKRDYDEAVDSHSAAAVRAICMGAKAKGVRFISVDLNDLICFENVECDWGHPTAWSLAKDFDLNMGCGNGPQAQVDLWFINQNGGKRHYGVYDLRDDEPVKISPPVLRSSWRSSEINKAFTASMDLMEWLSACGVPIPESR